MEYKDFYESAPNMFVSVDAKSGNILHCNRAFCRTLRCEKEELIGLPILDICHPDSIPHAQKLLEYIGNTREAGETKLQLVRGDQARIDVYATASAEQDEEGKIALFHFILHVTTESKKSDNIIEKVRQQANLLADLIEHSSQPLGVGFPDGRLGTVNSAFLRLTGFTKEEISSIQWSTDLTPPKWREHELKMLEELHRTGAPVRYEKEYIRKDGSLVPVELFVHLIKDEIGRPMYYYAFVTDITERKKAERALQEREEFLRLSQSAGNIGSWEWEFDSNHVRWSDELYRIYGMRQEDFDETLNGAVQIIHPDDFPKVQELIRLMTTTGIAFPIRYRIIRKDGSVRWMQGSNRVLFDSEGKPRRAIGTVQDITERKQTEEEVRDRGRRQATIAQLGHLALKNENPPTLINTAVDLIAEALRVEFVKVLELLPDRRALKLVAGTGWKEGLVGHALINIGRHSQAGYALRKNHPVIVEDLSQEQRFSGSTLLLDHNIFSGMSVVINGHDGPWGVLGAHTTKRHKFTPEDVEFFQTAGNILAGVLEHNRAETELRRSEEKYRRLVESSPYCIHEIDPDGRLFSMNPAGLSMMKISSEKEILGVDYCSAVAENDRDRVASLMQEAFKGKVVQFEFKTPDGNFFASSFVPLFDSNRKVVRLMGITNDITAEKRVEAALRDSHTRLEKAQEVARMGFLDWNLKNDEIYWSDEVCRLYGFPPGSNRQTIESTVALVHPDDLKQVQKLLDLAVQGKAEYRIDHRMVRPNGDVIWVQAQGELELDAEGAPSRFLGTVVDITDRKNAEDELRRLNEELESRVRERTAKLEAANRELDSFTYSVSHDLRAPLRSIRGFSGIIARRHRNSLNEEGRHYFDNIVEAGDQMVHLIEDLLSYSRLGRQALQPVPVNLKDLVHECVRNDSGRIRETNAAVFISEDLPVVRGDSTLLTQIFSNLLDNALKYRRKDTPPVIRIESRCKNGSCVVSIEDNGEGIAPEYQEKIFDVFQRLHSQDEVPGTGVGLATVKKSVELLGGRLWLESTVGIGSTFYIELDLVAGEEESFG